jgi:hypothetical protein
MIFGNKPGPWPGLLFVWRRSWLPEACGQMTSKRSLWALEGHTFFMI